MTSFKVAIGTFRCKNMKPEKYDVRKANRLFRKKKRRKV